MDYVLQVDLSKLLGKKIIRAIFTNEYHSKKRIPKGILFLFFMFAKIVRLN